MSVSVYNNERSLAEDIAITWDAKCKANTSWAVKSLGAEISINATKEKHEKGKNGMNFPDLVLYGSVSKTPMSILQMWELKCPDVPLTDKTLLPQAIWKANFLGLSSTLIWNFQYGKLYVKNITTKEFEEVKSWKVHPEYIVKNRADALSFVDLYKPEIDTAIDDMFVTVNSLLSIGSIPKRVFTFEGAEYAIQDIINNNKLDTATCIKDAVMKNRLLDAVIDDWWSVAKIDYSFDETNKYIACSKKVILNWLQKILFANIIKGSLPKAADVEKIVDSTDIESANNIFKDVTASIDFFTMFYPIDFNTYLSDNAWQQVKEFNKYIIDEGIPTVSQDSLQSILNTTVTAMKRDVSGLYSESPILAEILVGITMLDMTKPAIDPCCGTGTISRKILDTKLKFGVPIENAYKTTWSSDYNSFPLQVASLALTTSEGINIPAIVYRKNIFEQNIGDDISITNPKDGSILHFIEPPFEYIISNLPFIDFNTETVSFPSSIKKQIIKDIKKKTKIELDEKNDIYAFILFYIWDLLNTGGRIGVIISNSWLKGTNKKFFDALTQYYKIVSVIISGNDRWFANVDTITTLLIAEKKNVIEKTNDNILFGRLLENFSDIESYNDANQIINDILCEKTSDKVAINKKSLNYVNNLFNKGLSLNYMFYETGWYKDVSSKVIPIDDIFKATRGLKSGADYVFYPNDASVVDAPFIQGMLKNGKDITTLIVNADSNIIMCDQNIPTLLTNGFVKTASYFNTQYLTIANNKSAKANESKNIRNGKPWYSPFAWNITDLADIVIPLNNYERIYCGRLAIPSIVNQRLVAFTAKPNTDMELCHALLNSIFFIFAMEAGANPMGLGALDNNATTIKKLPMLNPALLTKIQRDDIVDKFKPLLARDILSVEDEFHDSDREKFDRAVLKAYGIEKHYEIIKKEILTMMQVRLNARKLSK